MGDSNLAFRFGRTKLPELDSPFKALTRVKSPTTHSTKSAKGEGSSVQYIGPISRSTERTQLNQMIQKQGKPDSDPTPHKEKYASQQQRKQNHTRFPAS